MCDKAMRSVARRVKEKFIGDVEKKG